VNWEGSGWEWGRGREGEGLWEDEVRIARVLGNGRRNGGWE
jgi:hypothetical protein